MPASDSIFRCNCKQSNSNWPLPGPTLYKQPPLILFLNTTPPILQLSSPGVLAECTASKHSQPAPLDKEKKKKQVRRRKKKRGGCFSYSEVLLKLDRSLCVSLSIRISVPIMARISSVYNNHSELEFFWMLLMAGISSAHHCSSFRISSSRRWPGVLNVCGRMWGLFSLCDNFRKSSAATIEHHMYIGERYK